MVRLEGVVAVLHASWAGRLIYVRGGGEVDGLGIDSFAECAGSMGYEHIVPSMRHRIKFRLNFQLSDRIVLFQRLIRPYPSVILTRRDVASLLSDLSEATIRLAGLCRVTHFTGNEILRSGADNFNTWRFLALFIL